MSNGVNSSNVIPFNRPIGHKASPQVHNMHNNVQKVGGTSERNGLEGSYHGPREIQLVNMRRRKYHRQGERSLMMNGEINLDS